MSHTPTPWTVAVIEPKTASMGPTRATLMGPPVINYERGQYFKPQDAAFIVKAVNAHDELVETLKRILKRATPHPEDEDFDRARQLRHIKSHCEAALAKAGEL